MLFELDFATVVNDKHVSSINADDEIGSNVPFVCFAENSPQRCMIFFSLPKRVFASTPDS